MSCTALGLSSIPSRGSVLNFYRARPSRRHGVFCLIAIAHLGAVLFWPALKQLAPAPGPDQARSTLWLLPTPDSAAAPQNKLPLAVAAAPELAHKNRHMPLVRARERAVRPNAAPATSAAISVALEPAPMHARLIAGFKRDGGNIDRELRGKTMNGAERTPELRGSALARGIGAAFIDRTPASQEEVVLTDGTRVTRIGNTCYMKDHGGRARGMDHISRGVPTVARDCWQAGLPMR